MAKLPSIPRLPGDEATFVGGRFSGPVVAREPAARKPPKKAVAKKPVAKKPVEEVRTVNDFLKVVFDFAHQDDVLFRGQRRASWGLEPTLARITARNDGDTPLDVEDELMRRFKRQYLPHFNGVLTDDWEVLAVAQHHGLNTRMLDWSQNPLAALWFAVRKPAEGEPGKPKEPGAVFMFQPAKHEDYADVERESKKSPYEVNRTLFYQPNHRTQRIVAQSGWLSVHAWSEADGKFSRLDKLDHYSGRIKQVHIPPGAFSDIRNHLDRIGVNEATLFPDLDGLCTHLNWYHSLLKDEIRSRR